MFIFFGPSFMRYPNVLRGSRDLTFYVFRTTLIALDHIDAQWATTILGCYVLISLLFLFWHCKKKKAFYSESKSGAKKSEKMQWKQWKTFGKLQTSPTNHQPVPFIKIEKNSLPIKNIFWTWKNWRHFYNWYLVSKK